MCGPAANPVPLYTQYALVSNLCPECKTGDLDTMLTAQHQRGCEGGGRCTQHALVSNLCPECKAGDLDLELAGDRRWTDNMLTPQQ